MAKKKPRPKKKAAPKQKLSAKASKAIARIYPFLWYATQAEEAAAPSGRRMP